MKSFARSLFLVGSIAIVGGCNSAQHREVSLSNGEIAGTRDEESQSGAHFLRVSRTDSGDRETTVQPIPSALPNEPPPRHWSSLLNPFQSKNKRIPLPLSKPIDGEPEIESGINAF